MSNLIGQFENETPYVAWINADVYPSGKVFSNEYVQWLENRIDQLSAPSDKDIARPPIPPSDRVMDEGKKPHSKATIPQFASEVSAEKDRIIKVHLESLELCDKLIQNKTKRIAELEAQVNLVETAKIQLTERVKELQGGCDFE